MRNPILAVTTLTVFFAGAATAQDHEHKHEQEQEAEAPGHSHAQSELHGGEVTMTKEFHFEVAFLRDRVRIYGYDRFQIPLDLSGVSGDVKIQFRDKKRPGVQASLSYLRPKAAKDEHDGHDHQAELGFLDAKVDLSEVADGEAKATVSLQKLPGKDETEVTFKTTFALAFLQEYACPMKCTDPAADPGKCNKCGMSLKPARFLYRCSMHPKVTSRKPNDKCRICGMKLEKSARTADSGAEHGGKKKSDHDHDGHDHGHL